MSEHRAHRRTRACGWFRSLRVKALLSLGLVATISVGGSMAYWSDTATVTGVTLTAGTLDLKVNNVDNVTGYTAMNISNMVPGNSTAGVLTVRNAGTVPLTYTITSSGTNTDSKNLVGALVAKVTTDSVTTGTSPAVRCAGTAISSSGTSFTGGLVGSGIKRTLAAGSSETICIQATLPTNAAASLQGGTTNITFTLTADQIQ